VLGADIVALRRPVAAPRRTVVVVGGIHGNEPASPPVVRSLVEVALPPDVEVWLIPQMNVDGVARGTRTNANDVDLNRNFGWTWRPGDGGPAPFSEPETQAVTALIENLRPGLVIWMHQPLGYVSSIGATADAFEQAWARGSGLPVRPDVTQHGGGESWTAFTAGLASMLVEFDGWDATPAVIAAQQDGFRELVAAL
jgi:murein peptide amidase A